jgi:hypothetical protein
VLANGLWESNIMIFGGRIKRQQRIAQITDPLVHKSELMMTELLKKKLGKETEYPVEILRFSMWLVYLGFSTAKPNPSKKEGQSLNDAYNQQFINLGMDAYESSELKSQISVQNYATQYARDLMEYFMTRCSEYNDAFNRDKGSSFLVSEVDFSEFVPDNLLSLAIRNIYGEGYEISDPSELDQEFVHGFMDFFTRTVDEVTSSFRSFSL